MAETVGALIFASIEAAGVTGAAALGSTAIVGTLTVNAVVGAAALTAASIGLQYALNNPNIPKPESGAQPLKQSVPIRQRGYWTCRLAGYYLLYIGAGGNSQDVLAFHSGRIEKAMQLYLFDTPVSTTGTLAHGEYCTVVPPSGINYEFVALQVFYGTDTQNVCDVVVNAGTTSGAWTSAHQALGIACIAMGSGKVADPSEFTKVYPQGVPLPSVVAKCAPIWDPRDPAQSRFDRSTWRASPNPVLQLIDYLTEPDGGMGFDLDDILPPAALAQWMVEADLCDGRYYSAGFYQYDNAPEAVINKILSTCDGWMCEAGDGSLALTVGVYREPTDPPLTDKHILGCSISRGIPFEELVNRLDISFTNPAAGYVTDQIDPVRDEDSISQIGEERPKPLDLTWVQDEWQAGILGQRAMLRLNAKGGTFVTDLYGLRYLGRRWIPVQYSPLRILNDCVVEIQDRAKIDLLAGRVTFTWKLIDREALAALGAAQPAMLREDLDHYLREDGSILIRES